MKKSKKPLYWLGITASLFLLTVISWMALETGVEITSHADFCSVCHSMEPVVKSYKASIHGGWLTLLGKHDRAHMMFG